MTSLIRLATEDVDLVGEMRECMCRIPWSLMDKINEFDSSWFKPPPIVVKDDIDGAQQDIDMDEGVETAASQKPLDDRGETHQPARDPPPTNEDENMEEDESLAETQKPSENREESHKPADTPPGTEDEDMEGGDGATGTQKPSENRPQDREDDLDMEEAERTAGTLKPLGDRPQNNEDFDMINLIRLLESARHPPYTLSQP